MAESEREKAHRLKQLREERRKKAERRGDTPEAKAERRKDAEADEVKQRIGNGVIWS